MRKGGFYNGQKRYRIIKFQDSNLITFYLIERYKKTIFGKWKWCRVWDMGTDTFTELKWAEEWIEKGYLRATGERDEHLIPIYEINPLRI